jgi:hypothetical protein
MILEIFLAALLAAAPAAEGTAPDPMETGRRYTDLFWAGKTDQIWEQLTPKMKVFFGAVENLSAFRRQVEEQVGAEERVVSERILPVPPLLAYTRIFRATKASGAIMMQWGLDDEGRVAAFVVRPHQEASSEHLEYQTKTPLRLPFDGDWFVGWGGRTLADNYHAESPNQRFAYDLLILRDGKSHTGDGTANEQYHCFGQPILAPGPGKVAAAVDGIDDNKPGEMNPKQPVGNHVILDHGNGEFSFLAHLKKGSVAVETGDAVKAGDRLGVCGNSGNSSEAHLHYHLQTTPRFADGEGLPAWFLNYVADGKAVEKGEPVRGQTIRPGSPQGADSPKP